MFTFLLDLLTEKGRGIHAYAAVAKVAFERAVSEPEHAAAFYVLATSAENFVDLHERQPLSSKALEQSFDAFRADVEAFEAASTGNAEQRLSVLTEVVKSNVQRTR
ncbi:hypothetical protein [Pacificibacter marinus]|uniref:hypothetical protein n=1 Tax=Pacificibacter marinus TaxID=658057 RepID=UPI001C07C53E|nr:hypothetical protein [Pacificibacter marinus]MBU2867580.1 hypothetical protein [Pacificibacter marinus]